MADQPITPDPTVTPARPRKRTLRRLLVSLGLLVLLLIILVALAPTLASTGVGRGLILGQVNKQLNGTVSVDSWNLGWFSNISASDVVVRDAAGGEVIKLKSLQTQLTVLEAARMNFDAGQVTIDGLWADITRDEDGQLNVSGLVKESDSTPADSDQPATLPDVSATITITNSGGTYEDATLAEAVEFGLAGEVAIANINQPIRNDIQLTTTVGQGKPGTIALSGQADIAENNQLRLELPAIKQSLRISGLELASVAAFLPPQTLETLSGVGAVILDLEGVENGAALQGVITLAEVVAGGPALNGDVVRQRQVRVEIPRTLVRLPGEGQAATTTQVVIGSAGESASALRVAFDQGVLMLRGTLSGDTLANLAANERPGGAGEAVLTADIDVGGLAQQLRNTLSLNPELEQLTGKLSHRTTLTMTAEAAAIDTQTDLTEVSAVREGKPVTLKPISLTAAARSLGGGGSLPDLRDMRLVLNSGFASADITGRDLGSVKGAVRGSLDDMQRELAQFVEFGDVRLAGTFQANPSITGRLMGPGTSDAGTADAGTAQISLPVTLENVAIEGAEQEPIRLEQVQIAVTGTLVRGGEGEPFLRAVRGVQASARAGNRQTPAIDLAVQGDVELRGQSPQVPRWEITRGLVNLPALQHDLPQLAQAIQDSGTRIASGQVTIGGRGSYEGNVLTLNDLVAGVENATLQTDEGRPVVERMNLRFNTTGKVAFADDATRINLSALSLEESRGYLSLKKTSGGQLALVLPADGGYAAAAPGELEIGASLGFVNQVMQAFGDTQVTAQTRAGQIQQGFLNGTIRFEPQAEAQTRVAGDFKVRNLTILTDAEPLQAGDMTLALEATSANDATRLSVSRLDLGSQFASVNASDVQVNLAAESPFGMLQSGTIKLDVPDAGPAWAVKEAFAPGEPTPGEDGGEPVPPLNVAAGRIQAEASIASEGGAMLITLRDFSGEGVRLVRGPADRTLDPFKLVADARIQGDAQGNIQQLAMSRLNGNFGFANIDLAQPLAVTGLGEGQTLALNGTIRGDADMERTLAIVNLLSGSVEAAAYAGKLNFTQAFQTRGDSLSATIDAVVREFRTLGEGAQQINDDIQLTGGVGLNLAEETLQVRDIRLQMPQTRAIDLLAQGTIGKYSTERQLDLSLTLKTDWEKLWQVVYPLLPEETKAELADAKAFGIEERAFKVTGTYPADKPMHEAIKGVVATGGLGLKSFQGMGVDAREVDVPFKLENGKATLLAARQAVRGQYTPNMQINSGIGNVMNITVDLTHPDGKPRYNVPENYKLLVGASLNPMLSDKLFGKFINPMMADARQARGRFDVIIEHCENFDPTQITAGEANVAASVRQGNEDAFEAWRRQQRGGEPDAAAQAAMKAVDTDPGRLQIRFSITDMQLGSPTIENLLGLNIVNANVRDSRITVSRGVITSDVGININDQGTIRFTGAVRALDSTILNMVASYPKSLLPTRVKEMIGDTGMRALPESFALPMSGPMGAVQFDLMGAVQENIKGTLLSPDRIGDTLGDVLNRNRREEPAQPQQPQPRPQQPQRPQQGPQTPIGQQPIGRPRIEPPPGDPQPQQPAPDRRRIEPRNPQQQPDAENRPPERRDPLGDLIRVLTDEERQKEQDRQQQERSR